MHARCLLFALSGLIASASASASGPQTFTCGNSFVRIGDHKSTILGRCGEPQLKDSFCKPHTPGQPRPSACETVDEWTYYPGSGQFMTTLRMESGKLVLITYGDRVK